MGKINWALFQSIAVIGNVSFGTVNGQNKLAWFDFFGAWLFFRKGIRLLSALIHSAQAFQHHGSPRLIDCLLGRFERGAEREGSVRQGQGVVHGFNATQNSNPRVHNRSRLKIEEAWADWIDHFQAASLALVTEKFDQLGKREIAEFSS